jgi:uncharacterized protein YggT (Ycf19 family)
MEAFLAVLHNLVMLVGIFYIAQFIVGIFNWPARENNPIYRLFRFLTSPVTKAVRVVTPAAIQDRHVPIVAFFLLFWLYVGLFFARLCTKYPQLCSGA